LNHYYITALPAVQNRERKSGPIRAALAKHFQGYFGGGVVVLEPFLLFLPPLWAVVFFPLLVDEAFGAGLSVDAGVLPVAWAIESVAPSNMANAIVSSFFIQSPSGKSVFLKQVKLGGY
jgi:hypothetical protein